MSLLLEYAFNHKEKYKPFKLSQENVDIQTPSSIKKIDLHEQNEGKKNQVW